MGSALRPPALDCFRPVSSAAAQRSLFMAFSNISSIADVLSAHVSRTTAIEGVAVAPFNELPAAAS